MRVQLSHDFVEGTLNDEKTSRIWENLKIVLGRWVGGWVSGWADKERKGGRGTEVPAADA